MALSTARSGRRCAFAMALTMSGSAQVALAFAEAGTEAGQCEFANDPLDVGFFWDPTCELGKLGCNADGRNIQCRLCGAGAFISISCPPSSCKFPNDPFVSYYWDNECEMGKLGCWADGIHAQCRFCGDYPFTSISCPEGAAPPNGAACVFENEPITSYYWEAGCVMGMHGCNADGVNVRCRFCGGDEYWDIPCPAEQVCAFAQAPTLPYFWDPTCKDGLLGCKADGVHQECRFCAARPFEDVACPEEVAPPTHVCTWPLRGEPLVPYFWDETCELGMLGCWADGIHAECRLCGSGVYSSVTCPSTSTTEGLVVAHAGKLQQEQTRTPASPAATARGATMEQDSAQAATQSMAASNVADHAHDLRLNEDESEDDEDSVSGTVERNWATLPLCAVFALVRFA